MTALREAATQALEALDGCYDRSGLIQHNGQWVSRRMAAMDALKAALEQPEQEPVAMCRTWHKGSDQHAELLDWTDALEALPDGEHPLFTHPPRREWRGLTDEEREAAIRWAIELENTQFSQTVARAIEAKLKEKNA
ncbi:MAG: hypothetical protein ACO3IN_13550 [Steroidobacteraceae bacterium]